MLLLRCSHYQVTDKQCQQEFVRYHEIFLQLQVGIGLLLTCAIRFLLECGMDWKNIIEEIQAAGFSQTEIADYVGKSQAWVSAIAHGKVADVRYSDGAKLLSMRAMPPARHAA